MTSLKFLNKYEGEAAIQELIRQDNNCSAHFHYRNEIACSIMDLITFNPVHKTHFLLHSLSGDTQIKAINKMYDHIYKLKQILGVSKESTSYNSYTVEWYCKAKEKSFKSHFYGSSVEEILHKFYYGKVHESFNILTIKLNPMS